MSDDHLCEVADLVSLLEVRDLIREYGLQRRERERAKGLDPETWERLRKLMPPPREEVRHELVAGPRRLDLCSSGPCGAAQVSSGGRGRFRPQRQPTNSEVVAGAIRCPQIGHPCQKGASRCISL